jgi:hypothetical protein
VDNNDEDTSEDDNDTAEAEDDVQSEGAEIEDNTQRTSRYNFRPNRTRDYSHRFEATQLFSMHDPHKLQKEITGYIMTQ